MANQIIYGSYYASTVTTVDGEPTAYIGAIRQDGYDDTPIIVKGETELEASLLQAEIVRKMNND